MSSTSPALMTASLVGRLQESFGIGGDNRAAELDLTRLRYVIYARKSTDSSEKQERSIPDQLHACRELADRLGVKVVDRIHEEQSAKLSDKRPKFREMLDGIVNGKYDGIIVWSPDRLARNMKEAGEIIDLLDRGVIKDLKFANNFVFANEPSGKMLLGISFVMAKQYSDQHGQNVERAIRRKTSEGKYAGSHTKHGYYKDGHTISVLTAKTSRSFLRCSLCGYARPLLPTSPHGSVSKATHARPNTRQKGSSSSA